MEQESRLHQAVNIVAVRRAAGVPLGQAVSEAVFRLDLTNDEQTELIKRVTDAERINAEEMRRSSRPPKTPA